MKNLSITSFFGGSEVIRVNYPTVYSTILSIQKKQKEDVESLFNQIKQDYSEMIDIGIHIDIQDPFTQPLPYPNMKFIEVYLLDTLAIYFPKDSHDFWFDILSLDYLFSTDLFNAGFFCLSKKFLLDRNIEINYLFNLLNDPSFSILKFPLLFVYETNIKETTS